MPLRETEAIVLRTFRLGEADKIVSLLTRQHGRLRAVASGAQRSKSQFGGTLEPLSYLRMWLFERENRDLLRVRSTELLESFFVAQSDYRVHAASQYLAEAAEQLLPEREVNERAFRLILAVMRALKQGKEVERPLLYFNFWLLRVAGFGVDWEAPQLCGQCQTPLAGQRAFYGQGLTDLRCQRCRPGEGSVQVDLEALRQAQQACRQPLDQWLAASPAPAWTPSARRYLEHLVEAHCERKLRMREWLAEALESPL